MLLFVSCWPSSTHPNESILLMQTVTHMHYAISAPGLVAWRSSLVTP
jgi:hypothetical protein